ncbi:class I SAM-dependent methyltransferase [Thermomonospora cellulosilytica]|uniref:SAM-dependent methyltransferase n=1 Tax=Thermomonospora cellulosilytica TaxID=1411118 RepID=A0A7W3R6U6_9ACTN|nr:class I SAM-dependent methyltransferase [Thermomonospora cellulosilytica]MBA9001695.1 SAM-dependent methyltransferase [Thermomonospora cellulosilytica]
MDLLDDNALEWSPVVANCAMNRERRLTGYCRELGLDIPAFLRDRLSRGPAVRWLDLCCGSGRALAEAAALFPERVEIVGVDLVDAFAVPARPPALRLVTASIATWTPDGPFDLVTSVHGLHYVGDKLGVLARAASWLTEDGRFAANFDARSVLLENGGRAGRPLLKHLRDQGFTYDPRTRRISRQGRGRVTLPYRYLGADDRAGPNYTGQPAVDSCYTRV